MDRYRSIIDGESCYFKNKVTGLKPGKVGMFAKYTLNMSNNTIENTISQNTNIVQKGPGPVAPMHIPDDTVVTEVSGET